MMIGSLKKLCLLGLVVGLFLESSKAADKTTSTNHFLRRGLGVVGGDYDDAEIKGGIPARDGNPTKYPYFTNLLIDFGGGSIATCGGAVIHDDIVLTAAHCQTKNALETKVFMLNERIHSGGIERRVTQVLDHPQFMASDDALFFDYALMKLDSSALVDSGGTSTGVTPVQLNQNPGVPAPLHEVIIMGFGNQLTGPIQVTTDVLLESRALSVPDSVCFSANPEITCITHSLTAVCKGDSGGPVIDAATMTAIGLVSFGPECTPFSGGTDNLADIQFGFSWIKEEACRMTSFQTGLCAPPPTPPVTAAPVTAAPTTATPTTGAPVTAAPTTATPTTGAPVTAAPTTATPTTATPTRPPTTLSPTRTPPRVQNFNVTNTYIFDPNYTPSDVSISVLRELERTTDIYYTRLIASDFNLNYDEVEVKFVASSVRRLRIRDVNVAVDFKVQVEYRSENTVPPVSDTLTALIGTERTRSLYVSDFVSIAGGIFEDVVEVRMLVVPNPGGYD